MISKIQTRLKRAQRTFWSLIFFILLRGYHGGQASHKRGVGSQESKHLCWIESVVSFDQISFREPNGDCLLSHT